MNTRSANPSPEFNRDREFAVILEDINSKFDLLAEAVSGLTVGQTSVINRLDRIEVRVDRLDMKTDVIYKELSAQRTDINGQRADIREIKNILLSHDKRLANLELSLR